jgi:hypothetical protein
VAKKGSIETKVFCNVKIDIYFPFNNKKHGYLINGSEGMVSIINYGVRNN